MNGEIEVLVVVDGCHVTKEMDKTEFDWVDWYYLDKTIGASRARNFLFKLAKGDYLIGLDDDANFISKNPLFYIEEIFRKNLNLGIIAFQEKRGRNLMIDSLDLEPQYLEVNDFIGCGFCINRNIYLITQGFPIWMDIYGEESCLSLEVLDKGYKIIYTNMIVVHHRIDKEARNLRGHDLFRFGKSLVNGNKYFLVYYPIHMLPKYLFSIFYHNLLKYSCKNKTYFWVFFKSYIYLLFNLFIIIKHRKPVKTETIMLRKKLKAIQY